MVHLHRVAVPLFSLAALAIGIHVVDDNFAQPQPGTSAADHLFSGIVPLCLLAIAAWMYPRARAGTRAVLALGLVLPAALSGVEALYYAGKTGLSGDDYTGLLAMLTAPVLLAIGASTLWASRRRGDHPGRRYTRRAFKCAGVAIAVVIAGPPLAIAYIGAHVARADVPELGIAHQDVKLKTSDGLVLDGWYVPSRNRAAVIVFPGRSGTRRQARMLARHGYGVLLYDRRGEGRSEGDPDSWGWDFDKDIRAGLDFLKGRGDVDAARIGGIGLSVGGEMLLQTAAETTDLRAVVAEGAGARSAREEVDDVSGFDKLTAGLAYGVRDLANSVMHDRLPPENLITLIPKIAPRPVFLIHAGDHDVGHRAAAYYRAAGEPKQIWQARGGHTDGIKRQPREYERRVVAFFDGALTSPGT